MIIYPRLALGVGQNPDAFDNTGLVNLTPSDPFVRDNMYAIKIREEVVPEMAIRVAASRNSARALRRTGYGTWFDLDMELMFETSRVKPPGFVNNVYPNPPLPQPVIDAEVDEGLIPTIANFLGLSSTGLPSDGNAPYFFLNVNYLTPWSVWIPMELHPEKNDFAPAYGTKTFTRALAMSFRSRYTYKAITRDMVPAKMVRQAYLADGVTYNTVLSMPANPGGPGPWTGTIVVAGALPSGTAVGDTLAVRFHPHNGASYGRYYIFTITSISGNQIGFTTAVAWPSNIPNAGYDTPTFRVMKDDPMVRMYVYTFLAFGSSQPTPGWPVQAAGGTIVPGITNRSYFEVPTGTRNGTNKVFTVLKSIVTGTEEVFYKNGPLDKSLYTVAGNQITLGATVTAPVTYADGSVDPLLVSYSYAA